MGTGDDSTDGHASSPQRILQQRWARPSRPRWRRHAGEPLANRRLLARLAPQHPAALRRHSSVSMAPHVGLYRQHGREHKSVDKWLHSVDNCGWLWKTPRNTAALWLSPRLCRSPAPRHGERPTCRHRRFPLSIHKCVPIAPNITTAFSPVIHHIHRIPPPTAAATILLPNSW